MRIFITILFLSSLLSGFVTPAGPAIPAFITAPVAGTSDLIISYSITFRQKKDNAGIGEIYNGGIQTLFAGKQKTRLRLASLMRIESTFALFDNGHLKNITLIKESGSKRQKTVLSPDQWTQYNNKYSGATCHLTEDTILILKHLCKKAIITLKDNRQITAYYYPAPLKPSFYCLQPAFSGIPGIVLKYEYTYRRKTIVYTATSISHKPISEEVFTPPGE
jgi:hypothetical protein